MRAVTSLGSLLIGREESATIRSRLLNAAAGLISLRVVFSALSFLLTVVLARWMGPQSFGIYSYSFAWVVLLCIPAIFGLDQLLVRGIAGHVANSEWGRVAGLLQRSTRTVLAASISIVVLAAAVSLLLRN